MNIKLISTYPPTRCGVGAYSERLVEILERFENIHLEKVALRYPPPSNPLYYIDLLKTAEDNCIVHLQFEYGLFGNPGLVSIFKCVVSAWNLLSLLLYIKFKKYKSIITMHFVSDSSKKIVFDKIERIMCRLSDKVIVLSPESKRRLLKPRFFRVSESNLVYIPHGCEMLEYTFGDVKESKRILGAADKKILLTYGFIVPYKNTHFSVALLRKLPEDTVLVIAGDTDRPGGLRYKEKIKRQIKSFKLEERVILRDYPKTRAEESLIFAASDVVIIPYRDVHQSGILNITVGYGKPLICSDLPYFREIKERFDCLEIAEANNKKQFVDKILSLLNNEERRKELEINCRNYAHFYELGVIAEKHAEVYKALSSPDRHLVDDATSHML